MGCPVPSILSTGPSFVPNPHVHRAHLLPARPRRVHHRRITPTPPNHYWICRLPALPMQHHLRPSQQRNRLGASRGLSIFIAHPFPPRDAPSPHAARPPLRINTTIVSNASARPLMRPAMRQPRAISTVRPTHRCYPHTDSVTLVLYMTCVDMGFVLSPLALPGQTASNSNSTSASGAATALFPTSSSGAGSSGTGTHTMSAAVSRQRGVRAEVLVSAAALLWLAVLW